MALPARRPAARTPVPADAGSRPRRACSLASVRAATAAAWPGSVRPAGSFGATAPPRERPGKCRAPRSLRDGAGGVPRGPSHGAGARLRRGMGSGRCPPSTCAPRRRRGGTTTGPPRRLPKPPAARVRAAPRRVEHVEQPDIRTLHRVRAPRGRRAYLPDQPDPEPSAATRALPRTGPCPPASAPARAAAPRPELRARPAGRRPANPRPSGARSCTARCGWRKEDGPTADPGPESLRRRIARRGRPPHADPDARICTLAAAATPTRRNRLCRPIPPSPDRRSRPRRGMPSSFSKYPRGESRPARRGAESPPATPVAGTPAGHPRGRSAPRTDRRRRPDRALQGGRLPPRRAGRDSPPRIFEER